MNVTRLVLVLVAVSVAAIGCEKNRTEIVLGMATDLSAPAPLSQVELQVFSLPDGGLIADQPLPISGSINNLYELPGTYAVYSADGSANRFRVVLTATDSTAATLVVRSAVLSLVPEKTLFARLGVVSACEGMTDCGAGETCIEGRCASEEIDSSRLPAYKPGMEKEIDCVGAGDATFVDTSTTKPLAATGTTCGAGTCLEGVCLAANAGDGGGLGDAGSLGDANPCGVLLNCCAITNDLATGPCNTGGCGVEGACVIVAVTLQEDVCTGDLKPGTYCQPHSGTAVPAPCGTQCTRLAGCCSKLATVDAGELTSGCMALATTCTTGSEANCTNLLQLMTGTTISAGFTHVSCP